MKHAGDLKALLQADPERLRILALVHSLRLPDCWIAAGFVRNAVWDFLHGQTPSPPSGDVDVIWFDPSQQSADADLQIENSLKSLDASIEWSVKNQRRMHVRNGDAPYQSASDAMRFWPETATAVAVRYADGNGPEIAAPFGLDDLYSAIVRPTPCFVDAKRAQFDDRLRSKNWLSRWPLLRVEAEAHSRTSVA
ncbi:MAG: hypothetical protein JWQ61_3587 [Collimonas fungivorans]|uniref:nucleotidyltransferase family protein n=1 Tax=Collimonas fungivorans TaxID=158899 RepID=UPI0026EBCD59|nr:nucleotidyltransferase family protein [Collimonas fungivorans]MDB5768773.1 hypothetical protein [Collimonas fungivorans]